MNPLPTILFTVAAIMLLGSPGPGMAALVATGKRWGMSGGLRFYWGLQAGLALACAVSAAGLFSIIGAVHGAIDVLMAVATIYLIWLAFRIATAPVGEQAAEGGADASASALSGFLLGVTNPKSYLACRGTARGAGPRPGKPAGRQLRRSGRSASS